MVADKSASLLDRLGGPEAVKAVVEEFYQRVVKDPSTEQFFADVKMGALKKHQVEFMKIAFTTIPDDLDIPKLLTTKHKQLFKKGLNETHFDVIATHFVGACRHLNVPENLIDEAVSIVGSLRPVFESGAREYGPKTLFQKLGGLAAVKAVVEEFYTLILNDPATAPFFEGINVALLKKHQVEFMKIAFTTIPEDLDVPALLTEKHRSLFERGLNGHHFDVIAKHFVGACQNLDVPQDLIDEAVGVIGPLRTVFEKGAQVHGVRSTKVTLLDRLGGPAAVKAVVDEFYKRVVSDEETGAFFDNVKMGALKKHQVEFMKVAFTSIPPDLDVAALMMEKHLALFKKGLNEQHFDIVAQHLVAACEHLDVPKPLIDEAVAIVGSLRPVFVKGAKMYGPSLVEF